eukprot:6201311-Pleurochrysis_carterae.AAC.5
MKTRECEGETRLHEEWAREATAEQEKKRSPTDSSTRMRHASVVRSREVEHSGTCRQEDTDSRRRNGSTTQHLPRTRMKGGIQVDDGQKCSCPPAFGSAERVPSTNALLPYCSMHKVSPSTKPPE